MDAVKAAEKVVECYRVLRTTEMFPSDAAHIAHSLVLNSIQTGDGFEKLFQQQEEHLEGNCG